MRPKYNLTKEQLGLLANCSPHWPKVFRYAKLMEQGVEFPAVNIFYNKDKNKWEYNDGRHRVMAAKLSNTKLRVTSKFIMGANNV